MERRANPVLLAKKTHKSASVMTLSNLCYVLRLVGRSGGSSYFRSTRSTVEVGARGKSIAAVASVARIRCLFRLRLPALVGVLLIVVRRLRHVMLVVVVGIVVSVAVVLLVLLVRPILLMVVVVIVLVLVVAVVWVLRLRVPRRYHAGDSGWRHRHHGPAPGRRSGWIPAAGRTVNGVCPFRAIASDGAVGKAVTRRHRVPVEPCGRVGAGGVLSWEEVRSRHRSSGRGAIGRRRRSRGRSRSRNRGRSGGG